MKKIFLDLNYYSENTQDITYVLSKYKYSLEYLKYLPNKLSAISLNRINMSSSMQIDGVHYIFYKGRKIYKFAIPFAYHRFIKKISPDYVLIHGMRYGLYSYFLRKQLSKKTIIIVQIQGYAKAPRGIKKWLYMLSDRFVDGYFFTGKENARDWIDARVFEENKVFEVMEGATSFKFDPSTNRESQSFVWVGRLNTNKDPLTILQSFHSYLQTEPNAILTMAYTSEELLNEITSFLLEHNILKKAVKLVGKVKHQDLEKLYHRHQYFILGSHYEGSGYALAEAMACGCVPIVTKIPPFEFMTDNGRCALLFTPGDPEELLSRLYETKTVVYEQIQSEVLLQVENRLSSKAIARDIFSAFDHLSSKKQE